MSPLGSIGSAFSALPLVRPEAAPAAVPAGLPGISGAPSSSPEGFGSLLDGLVSSVETRGAHAQELTRKVLLGDSNQLHQSVIAMQEASTSFSLMVQVRNKLVESYQELMRMQV